MGGVGLEGTFRHYGGRGVALVLDFSGEPFGSPCGAPSKIKPFLAPNLSSSRIHIRPSQPQSIGSRTGRFALESPSGLAHGACRRRPSRRSRPPPRRLRSSLWPRAAQDRPSGTRVGCGDLGVAHPETESASRSLKMGTSAKDYSRACRAVWRLGRGNPRPFGRRVVEDVPCVHRHVLVLPNRIEPLASCKR